MERHKDKKKKEKENEADTSKWLLLDNQLCFRLYSASKALTSAYDPMLKPLDLTYPQYLAMMVLWEKDDISVGEIGERLNLDSGTLSPLLKKLEAKNILVRARSATDERMVTIKLTTKGHDLKKKVLKVPTQMICRIDLNEKEIADLSKRLDFLMSNLVKTAED
ncbi:MAG: MarR family transcriptional regulator [Rhizobacter sp.]|nr:MarR family transcriptional regulator [Bacteriovorax sp.]